MMKVPEIGPSSIYARQWNENFDVYFILLFIYFIIYLIIL